MYLPFGNMCSWAPWIQAEVVAGHGCACWCVHLCLFVLACIAVSHIVSHIPEPPPQCRPLLWTQWSILCTTRPPPPQSPPQLRTTSPWSLKPFSKSCCTYLCWRCLSSFSCCGWCVMCSVQVCRVSTNSNVDDQDHKDLPWVQISLGGQVWQEGQQDDIGALCLRAPNDRPMVRSHWVTCERGRFLLLSNIPAIFCFLCRFPNISNILVLETNHWLAYVPCSIIRLVHVLVHVLGYENVRGIHCTAVEVIIESE